MDALARTQSKIVCYGLQNNKQMQLYYISYSNPKITQLV